LDAINRLTAIVYRCFMVFATTFDRWLLGRCYAVATVLHN